VEVAN